MTANDIIAVVVPLLTIYTVIGVIMYIICEGDDYLLLYLVFWPILGVIKLVTECHDFINERFGGK